MVRGFLIQWKAGMIIGCFTTRVIVHVFGSCLVGTVGVGRTAVSRHVCSLALGVCRIQSSSLEKLVAALKQDVVYAGTMVLKYFVSVEIRSETGPASSLFYTNPRRPLLHSANMR